MAILLLNAGSSSLKYQVISDGESIATGLVQRIGQDGSSLEYETDGQSHEITKPFATHSDAILTMVGLFMQYGPDLRSIRAVGHRTVHGGDTFRESVRIDDRVLEKLQELSELAPLHNPPAISGINAAMAVLPQVPHVAIFDTAFFSTLPPEAYTYAIDREVAEKHGIRRYGFHGTSHSYVSKKAAEFLGRPLTDLRIITAHLGNGASITAVDGGVARDTSMGLTPLEGLVMGTRSGDIDPGVHAFLGRSGMSFEDVDNLLNKRSGMLGLCGLTDMRDVAAAVRKGDQQAKLAHDVYVHRLVGYIGSYTAIMGSVDALVFTAGVGENDAFTRKAVVDRLQGLGFHLDDEANKTRSGDPRSISTKDSPVKVLVVPTNEELAMAEETLKVIGG